MVQAACLINAGDRIRRSFNCVLTALEQTWPAPAEHCPPAVGASSLGIPGFPGVRAPDMGGATVLKR